MQARRQQMGDSVAKFAGLFLVLALTLDFGMFVAVADNYGNRNCNNCYNCYNCQNCQNGRNLRNCNNCNNCENCENCDNCYNSYNIQNCRNRSNTRNYTCNYNEALVKGTPSAGAAAHLCSEPSCAKAVQANKLDGVKSDPKVGAQQQAGAAGLFPFPFPFNDGHDYNHYRHNDDYYNHHNGYHNDDDYYNRYHHNDDYYNRHHHNDDYYNRYNHHHHHDGYNGWAVEVTSEPPKESELQNSTLAAETPSVEAETEPKFSLAQLARQGRIVVQRQA